jgi:hemerythrin superfamily protein
MNALELLKKDHAGVRSLFIEFARAGETENETRSELFAQIRRELQIHLRAEEEIFYPALKALNGDGPRLVSQAVNDHKDIEQMLTQISRLKFGDNFDEKFETLIESVDRHIEEDEGEIFQFAEENCSDELLDDVGQQLADRKRTLNRQMAA